MYVVSLSLLCLGNIHSDIIIAFETETEIYQSCSSTFNGEHFVIGGVNQSRQVYNYSDKSWKMTLNFFCESLGYIINREI